MPTASYIGPLAHLSPVLYTRESRVEREGLYTIVEAASRTWAYASAPLAAPPPRRWEITLTADNRSVGVLEGMAAGAYGYGPFFWIPESAYISNLLTPRVAHMVTHDGPGLDTVEGWAPHSHVGPAGTTIASGVPVLPDAPFTASVDCSGQAELRIIFRTATGALVSEQVATSANGGMKRMHAHVAKAPLNARQADIVISSHGMVAHPQATWVNKPTPWSAGSGATSVIINGITTSPMGYDPRGDLFQTVTLSMSEVR